MDWKKQFKVHDRSFRDICIILLVIAVNLFLLMLITSGPNPKAVSAAYRANCRRNQQQIYKLMCEFSGEEGFELPSEWTVADLIQEAVGKDRRSPYPQRFICRNVRYVRSFPYLKRERTEVDAPYLVFPVPASVVFDDSLQPPVPIVMCPPGAHKEYGTNVLYSNGDVKTLTLEEAEKLVAEQSPVPLKIVFNAEPEEEQTP